MGYTSTLSRRSPSKQTRQYLVFESKRPGRLGRTSGLSLLLGYHPTVGAALLVIFLLSASFGIHNFWTVQDQQAKQGEMINFLKKCC